MKNIHYITLFIISLLAFGCNDDSSFATTESGATNGLASSLAKFTISGNTLYYADFEDLIVYDITDGENPRVVNRVPTDIGIETIFPYGNYLFLGGQAGVEIYDISEPQSPSYTSTFVHSQACDPVIVRNDIAYVTLRQSEVCNSFIPNSVLNVLDVKDIRNPRLVSEIWMEDPYGLTFYKDDLYVSEGDLGLKKFDLTDPYNPSLDTFYTHLKTYDLLGLDDVLLITGNDGLYSFDVDGNDLVELAKIER